MSMSFEGDTYNDTHPGRWNLAVLDVDDPQAPLRARSNEVARVFRLTGFYNTYREHPEYRDIDFEVPDHDKETHYQAVTQDCDVIITQLRDHPATKLTAEQRRLIAAVAGLPRNTTGNTKIINAYHARMRYMRVITLAVACKTSLHRLPEVMRNAIDTNEEPLTDEGIADAIAAYENILVEEATDDDPNYYEFEWDNESTEDQVVRTAEEILGYREPPRRYQPAVSFELAQLKGFTFEQLLARQEAEDQRVLGLMDYLPVIQELKAALGITDESEMDEDTTLEIINAMETYLEWCINRLDDTETLELQNRRYVRKMLALPRNAPNVMIYKIYNQRTRFVNYLDDKVSSHYEAKTSHEKHIESKSLSEDDTRAAIAEAEQIFAETQKDLVARRATGLLKAAGEIMSTDSIVVRRSHMAQAVRAAAKQVMEQYWATLDDDDDDDDGSLIPH